MNGIVDIDALGAAGITNPVIDLRVWVSVLNNEILLKRSVIENDALRRPTRTRRTRDRIGERSRAASYCAARRVGSTILGLSIGANREGLCCFGRRRRGSGRRR